MGALTIQVLVTLLLAILVIYLAYKQLRLQNDDPNVPCVHQHICDLEDTVRDEYLVAAKTKELEKRRREYREWVENCNQIQILREREKRAT